VQDDAAEHWKRHGTATAALGGAVMDRDLARLKQNIARIRRDIRLQVWEMQQLIDADLDCSSCAQLLMRMQADLKLYLEKRERLLCKA
jgi:hypothetical protein